MHSLVYFVTLFLVSCSHAAFPNNNNYNNNQNYRRNWPNNNNGRRQNQAPQNYQYQYQYQFQGFEYSGLDWINRYRRLHQAQSMSLDQDLVQRAQACARYYASRSSIDHSCRQKNGAGENLYMMFTSAGAGDAARRAIQSWYAENRLYRNYNTNPYEFNTGTGHFTQVVWQSSQRLGLGVATVGRRTCVVALFQPPGNHLGRFKNNVLPPRF